MIWIESHISLPLHPKTRKLARRLELSIPATIGHLHCLWYWTVDYAPSGDLSGHSHEDIAIGAMWDDDPEIFIAALVESRWLDESKKGLAVHDWMEYAGRLMEVREKKSRGGRRGAEARWGTGTPNESAKGSAKGSPNGTAVGVSMASDSTDLPTDLHTDTTDPEQVRVARTIGVIRQELADRYPTDQLQAALHDLEVQLLTNPSHVKSPLAWTKAKLDKSEISNQPNIAIVDGVRSINYGSGWEPLEDDEDHRTHSRTHHGREEHEPAEVGE